MERRKTRKIMLGGVPVGGGEPVTVQSMTNTDTSDVAATLLQISGLECAGCDIVRVAVPDEAAAEALPKIIAGTRMPVVADIHFDHALALASIGRGVAGIRVNPGTIGNREGLKEVARLAAETGTAVRVGVNSGSLERKFRSDERHAEAGALARSALEGVALFEEAGAANIKVSVKASDVTRTIDAYRIVAGETDWPLHVGITEAGTVWSGTIKSAVGIGALLVEGMGDTIRVSLTAAPVEEVRVGRKILSALGLAPPGPEVISCPTCARTEIDVIDLAMRVEKEIERYGRDSSIRVAVMGCAVNGPGEAREADVGIAGGKEGALLFSRGEMVKRVPPELMFEELMEEVKKIMGGPAGDQEV